MIDHEKKIIFIHIPKCAGTFIEKHITPNIEWDKTGEKHLTMQDAITLYGVDIVRSYFKFSVVRNPYSRLLSFYLYHKRRKEELLTISLCDRFCRSVKSDYYAEYDDFLFNLKNYSHKFNSWVKNDLLSCSDFLSNYHGIEMDLIIKQEDMNDGLKLLQQSINIDFPAKKINDSPKKYSVAEYYNSQSIDFVSNLYRDDFHRFYPDFDRSLKACK